MSKKEGISEEQLKAEAKQRAVAKSKYFTTSIASAAYSINMLHEQNLDIETIVSRLVESVDRLEQGNLHEIEVMLITQAQSLNVLFNRSLCQLGNSQFVEHMQVCSDVALKAQTQCVKTLSALVALKRPVAATFIQQQNNAVNQQINRQAKPLNKKIPANELLETKNEKRLDTGEAITAITAHPQMAAMEVGRSED